MVWIIVWAGLLIVVLYSPVGSPGLYSSQNYFIVNQPVTVNTGTTLNAPKAKYSSENNDNDFTIPEVPSELTSNHTAASYQSGSTSSGGSSYGSLQTQSYQNTNSGSGNMGGGGSFIASGGSKSNSSGSSGITMTNGITSISTTSNMNNNNSKQSVINQTTTIPGGTDPGGDPTGNPIPVGDGWGILVFLGMCYVAFKKRYFIQKVFTIQFSKK